MNVSVGHPYGADARAFLEGVRPQIQVNLEEKYFLNGIKMQLALKVLLRTSQRMVLKSIQILYSFSRRPSPCKCHQRGTRHGFPLNLGDSSEVDSEGIRVGC